MGEQIHEARRRAKVSWGRSQTPTLPAGDVHSEGPAFAGSPVTSQSLWLSCELELPCAAQSKSLTPPGGFLTGGDWEVAADK